MSARKRRIDRKVQLKINNNIKKTKYRNVFFAPCYYCKYAFAINDLTIEHKVPICLGGSNDFDNIELSCAPCNQKLGKEAWIFKRNLIKKSYGYKNAK